MMDHNEEEFMLAPFDRINRMMRLVLPGVLGLIACGALVASIRGEAPAPALGVVPLVLLILGGCWAWSPRAVRVTADGLVIVRRILPPLTFPWSGFTGVRRLESWRGWKVCGCGGYYGYFGWFRLLQHGTVRLYATRRMDAVLVDGKPHVVVTVADTTTFMRALQQYLPPAK